MPYIDPERKRQWEREHREQRNGRRRALRLRAQTIVGPKPAPDPSQSQRPSGWKDILGLAVGVGIIVLGALTGASFTSPVSVAGKDG
jgi:hypothetical protein